METLQLDKSKIFQNFLNKKTVDEIIDDIDDRYIDESMLVEVEIFNEELKVYLFLECFVDVKPYENYVDGYYESTSYEIVDVSPESSMLYDLEGQRIQLDKAQDLVLFKFISQSLSKYYKRNRS